MQRRDFLRAGAAITGAAGLPAFAQVPAAGNMFIWSGFPAGGLGDQVTRPLLEQIRGKLPQNLVYDTKPGAGGRIAADFVKRSAPDGLNIMQSPASVMVLQPHVFKKLPYDTMADFTPVAGLCSFTTVLTAGPGLPAEVKTLAELLAWAKANPAQANIGNPSTGSAMHLASMLLAKQSGAPLNPVPYKGGAPLLNDLMGGQLPFSFNVVSEVLPHVRAGKLRAIAVTAPSRWKALPDTPTLTELGYKDLASLEWLGWFGPAGMQPARVAQVNAAVVEGLGTPAMIESLGRNGLEPLRLAPDRFAALVRQDHAYWGNVVKLTGFKPED
jgi:tripartite-type tricarboxylate transporter receptor subunit TctC